MSKISLTAVDVMGLEKQEGVEFAFCKMDLLDLMGQAQINFKFGYMNKEMGHCQSANCSNISEVAVLLQLQSNIYNKSPLKNLKKFSRARIRPDLVGLNPEFKQGSIGRESDQVSVYNKVYTVFWWKMSKGMKRGTVLADSGKLVTCTLSALSIFNLEDNVELEGRGIVTCLDRRRTVKNIPKYAPAQFYIDNVLPRIKEKKIMALKPFVDRLGYDNVPPEINKLRCRVNYHALKFLPDIEQMADLLASRMRNRTGSSNPYMALHLRFEKGMVGLSFCDFVGTREEKAIMAEYRKKEWPRRYKNGSHLWQLALQKRKEGRCPLEPGEVAVILRAMGYMKETQIYVASGQVYGGQNRMAPLRNMFPNLVTKEELATKEELDGFRKHVTSLAALDFLVCLKSDVFVMTHGGNFAKLIIGARRYMGHRLKSIKPDKGLMSKSFGDPYMGWAPFVEDVIVTHQTRTGLPEETFPNYDLWENPLTPCMCKA
ncbi:DUF246 domain-containing protein at1g04910-like protein [Trifolium pratense]|uniref:O-fucosyltransferase family protein n=2 Tax=Trifolium TaxID=3898 RepID=A0A2K3P3F9_TRIPR|nr:DUF246 domain-containing protein at1g04910-like protein [Trifolium pratense]